MLENFEDFYDYSLLNLESNFDRFKLGYFVNAFYDNNFNLTSSDNIPFSLYLVGLLPFICRLLTLNQVYISLPNEINSKIPINCYSFGFFGSGGGKGRVASALSEIMSEYSKRLKNKFDIQRNKLILELQQKGYTQKQESQLIDELKRTFKGNDLLGDITTAGFRSSAEKFSQFEKPIGGIFIIIDEFSEFIRYCMKNELKNDTLTTFFKIYDNGKLAGTQLKEKSYESIDFLPTNIVMTGTYKKLQNGDIGQFFRQKLDEGLARRAIMALPSANEMAFFEKRNNDDYLKNPIEHFNSQKTMNTFIYQNLKKEIIEIIDNSENLKELKLDEDALLIFYNYKEHCYQRSKNIKDELLKVEMINRFWKALKLAGVYHCLNTKLGTSVLGLDAFRQAIYTVEYFGFHFKRFIENENVLETDYIIKILLENIDKLMTGRDISRHRYFKEIKMGRRTPKQFLKDNTQQIREDCLAMGYLLDYQEIGKNKNGTQYTLTKIEV